jgi:hypothetical protein
LGKTPARNAPKGAAYSYPDQSPLPGDNYYRLRMVDLDGSYSYSPVRSVRFGGRGALTVYPNPGEGVFMVEMNAAQPGDFLLLMNDAQGRLRRREVVENVAGFRREVDLSGETNGFFSLRIITSDGRHSHFRSLTFRIAFLFGFLYSMKKNCNYFNSTVKTYQTDGFEKLIF